MSKIDLSTLFPLPAPTESEISGIRNRLETQQPPFVFKENHLAVLAFGGTIQSAYVPAQENIVPTSMNPALERTLELSTNFDAAGKNITGTILLIKDSRDVSNADLTLLIRTIEQIPNKRILVSCGTYMMKSIAKALDMVLGRGKSDKIIGITGSWLPATQKAQDVDYNVGGTIAAINAFHHADRGGIVFIQFHGEIWTGDGIEKLELHPPDVNPRFARPIVQTL